MIGLLVDAISKRARGGRPPARGAPAKPAASKPAAVPPVVVRVPSAAPSAAQSKEAADPFAAAVQQPGRPPRPGTPLLSAFGSPDRLLAAIVLSEALAPPLALRDNFLPPRDVQGVEMRRTDPG